MDLKLRQSSVFFRNAFYKELSYLRDKLYNVQARGKWDDEVRQMLTNFISQKRCLKIFSKFLRKKNKLLP